MREEKMETPLDRALAAVAQFVRTYVVLGEHEVTAVALWVFHTHAFDATETTPYLQVYSAEKRSGKSQLLEVLLQLVAKPWRAITPTEAVVFRKIAEPRPTLLLDEYDAIYGPKAAHHEGLRALLNAGFRVGMTVPRCVGDGSKMRVVDFEVFCPKALAGLGDLPDTVADRSIPIELRRRKRSETVAGFRFRDAAHAAEPLRTALAELAEESLDTLAEARPVTPEQLSDRAADIWEPLLAIADAAEGDWPRRAREAALYLSDRTAREDASRGVQLLGDVRAVFNGEDRLASAELVRRLNEIETSPWGGWNRGLGLDARGLALLVKGYGIKPASHRIGDKTPKGYLRADFEESWERYLSEAS
jgi:hypothetical protein